jgi:lipopolysaccharide export system protein LptA
LGLFALRFLMTVLALATLMAAPAAAQATAGAQLAFGSPEYDSSLPIEITADTLTVDQQDGTAIFEGSVLIGQGDMRLTAGLVRVEYNTADVANSGEISRLLASGGVTLVSGSETAEAARAEYSLDSGVITLTGSVLVTQGRSALSSESMTIDLDTGTGTMQGRVKTILQTGNN